MARLAGLVVVVCLLLAGCSGKPADKAPAGSEDEGAAATALEGWVFDPVVRPVSGANVSLVEINSTVRTDARGHYRFVGVPADVGVLVIVEKSNYSSASKQVTVPAGATVQLNFTLDPIPVKIPYKDPLRFEGFIACDVSGDAAGEEHPLDCGSSSSETRNVWQFSAASDLAGAMIEVFWQSNAGSVGSLQATLETLDLGERNFVVGQALGTSPLRIQVGETVARTYYPQGGQFRLTLHARGETDSNEAEVGAGAAIQQPFQAFATLFYVTPPDPNYSIEDET